MTNEEAIKALKRIRNEAIENFIGEWQDYEAFGIALKALADRKTEPTHDLRTKTHECVKDTHDKTSPNSSEKPNNSTISKMEQVEWTKEDCKGCKYNEYPYDSGTCFVRVCINGNKYEPKDEPQINEADEYWLSLLKDVVDGKLSAAGANQAWYEYINHKDEQTDCPWK